MKHSYISITLLFLVLGFSNQSYSQDNFPVLEGPYFGQKAPGLTPEIFAKDVVSINGRYEYGISFSPDLDEMYFSVQNKGESADIYFSKLVDKKWKPIKKAEFTKGKKSGEMEPFVSLDGKKIYFTAYNSDFTDTKIWVANRINNGWGNARKLNSPINNEEVFNSILAKNGDLFYTDIFKSKTYYSAFKNGQYPKVQEVEIEFGIHGFISPSQDYLLVDARNKEDKNRKDKDIYVYFKKKDGTWSKPINLGDTVNSHFGETVPSVTPDGKYLFFSRYNEEGEIANFYWVSTQVIENVRPKL
ncbi:PD40 domain-containing protein [Pseudoalteromonas denitrificans]|uniref:WD40-like Beta Propeller Repeat n=1 Tax=Pseudoalteromonas denitrificans DSM 6059 TaxID=1123010 RepID=A0A1I1K5Q0_9GAMM|nr:PD40 domain-containing protein [Pseudoalteromonas denitrificans]SFC56269.1 WD40-like Beta Propeller Repeat [Pseudoalteromonas denitrificans DSM 6059]